MKLDEFSDNLKRVPMTEGFVSQIEILRQRYKSEYTETAQSILDLFELLGLDAVKTGRKYIYDYLKQLDFFRKHSNYGHTDFNEIRAEIYDNEKTMLETYMPGLLLSYAYTTILYGKYHLFRNEFLPYLDEKMHGIEVGFGEGFYLWEIFKRHPLIKIRGFDISPYAVQFAAHVLETAGVSTNCYDLKYGNLLEGIVQPDASADFAVLAEVIEHIPDPQAGIGEIARMLKRGGYLYLTTVINSNHMDHISNFESPDVVEGMLREEGMQVMASHIYHMIDDFPDSKDISVGLAYAARKR